MAFAKKMIVVAVGLSDEMFEMLKPIKDMDFLAHSEIHFIHVFNTTNFTSVFSDFPVIYPLEVDHKTIEQSVLALMDKMTKDVVPRNFEGKVVKKCFFDDIPKSKFCEYVNEHNADLVIVPTRKKRGIFESSFAKYVNNHTQANMLLLK